MKEGDLFFEIPAVWNWQRKKLVPAVQDRRMHVAFP